MLSIISNIFYKSVDTVRPRNTRQDLSRLTTNGMPLSTTSILTQEENPPPYNWLLSSSTQVDRKGIISSIKLLEVAMDEFDSGNEDIALDVYLSGLEKIIMSLPNLKYQTTKTALREKLISLEERVGITPKLQVDVNNTGYQQIKSTDQVSTSTDNLITRFFTLSNVLKPAPIETEDIQVRQDDSLTKFKRLSTAMVDLIVHCVVLFKKSPLPGLIYVLFIYFSQLILWIDRYTQFSEKVQYIGITCIKQLLKADEKYHLHEFASEALYTLISASLKAVVAYNEAPGYNESNLQTTADRKAWAWSRSFSAATMTM